ncbi:small ribosomal subunit protein uS9m isoform X1 [Myotis daubentonii]|uniref:small ribosomal subunit protein uS9m isoform X1 n=1 Tax=Myotis daubentonii TaxID=98922 RepID=UPI002873D042|nr:small ribosomal subunit protein uS9m isoform X1 [Myotis daubentonii]
MAASCVSCGAAVSQRLLLRPRVSLAPRQVLWRAAELQSVPGPQILRLKHVTVVTTKKNVKALRHETYTVDFIKKQIEEFNIGKRHLANMMGEDPETFTQEDIDRAIAYLFPSGLFEKRARPIMKHPEQIFPKQKATQWGEDGRPFHYLFYTGKQSYYSLMHDTYGKILDIEKHKNQLQAKGLVSEKDKTTDLIGSRWLIKEELEEMLVEKLSDQDYAQFVRLMERLLQSGAAGEFVQRFRRSVTVQSKKQPIEPVQHDAQGMAFSTSEGRRKSAKAEAVVYEHGNGRMKINGVDYLLYFPVLQDREQLMFPFHFLDRLGKHDVTCTVSGGGRSAQAGAIRLAMARALCSFVTEEEVEWMRQASLSVLQLDCSRLIRASANGRSRARREPAGSLPGRSAECCRERRGRVHLRVANTHQ